MAPPSSWASTSGPMPGTTPLATASHATSNRLRSTGASHTAATFRRGRARFTQTGPDGRSTRHTSDETPPPSGTIGGRSAPTRPSRRSDASSGAEAHAAGGTATVTTAGRG